MEKFRAVVKSAATFTGNKTFDNGNIGKYNLHNVQILDGPLKGITVPGTQTIVNKMGKTKEPVGVGQEVIVFHRAEPKADGKGVKHFFEISTGEMSASDDEITALLAGSVAQTV